MNTEDTADTDSIIHSIRVVRGHRILLDYELAALYGVTTKRLNEQVKRNVARFPDDFVFRLTPHELDELETSNDGTQAQAHRSSRFTPWGFAEHGALAASFVLATPQAIAVGELVVRAFVRLRKLAASHDELARRLTALEEKVGAHDEDLQVVYDALRRLIESPAPPPTRRIGFHADDS
ncbi:MAG: ORF6N domain-containing protein [Acidobacteriota bacterium]